MSLLYKDSLTVEQLIKKLQELPENYKVILSVDGPEEVELKQWDTYLVTGAYVVDEGEVSIEIKNT